MKEGLGVICAEQKSPQAYLNKVRGDFEINIESTELLNSENNLVCNKHVKNGSESNFKSQKSQETRKTIKEKSIVKGNSLSKIFTEDKKADEPEKAKPDFFKMSIEELERRLVVNEVSEFRCQFCIKNFFCVFDLPPSFFLVCWVFFFCFFCFGKKDGRTSALTWGFYQCIGQFTYTRFSFGC